MKKFIKGSLITAGVFFAVGFIMLAICLAERRERSEVIFFRAGSESRLQQR